MNNIEKIKRHLGKPVPIAIENIDGTKDIFYLKPLNIGQQALLMEISKSIRENGESEIEIEENGKIEKKMVPNLTKEHMNEMFNIVLDVIKNSMPELDDEMAIDFCNTNFEQLSNALSKLTPEQNNKKDVDSLKKAQEAIQHGQ